MLNLSSWSLDKTVGWSEVGLEPAKARVSAPGRGAGVMSFVQTQRDEKHEGRKSPHVLGDSSSGSRDLHGPGRPKANSLTPFFQTQTENRWKRPKRLRPIHFGPLSQPEIPSSLTVRATGSKSYDR